MIRRLLIANRGEIARRIIRTGRRLGVETVAVYSDADADTPHVREADQAVRLGPPPARESYLRQDLILQAARDTGADAIHPGYGFLSENAEFAGAVTAAGLVWVGPPPSAILAMGLKDAAKKLMAEAGVPTTPGYLGEDQSEARLQAEADRIGYPVLIKAVAGGGGKGMRKVEQAGEFSSALGAAKREAAAAFGDDRVLLETYVTRPRHIEVQVFADKHGNVVHLFERDCSLQRRHQKVIEEAPAPGMDDAARAAVTSAAVRAAQAVNYEGAGTVEFIADASEGLRGDRIWFMEMNTRLQVEHPVTEMITGLDLVEWQLRVASGEPLPLKQEQLSINGHAMEARLYAENPATGFLPSTGPLDHFRLPEGAVRIDSAVEEGGEVSVFYDPMIAKLIAHAPTREETAAALAAACQEVEVWPVKTNAAFLARCLLHPDFVRGDLDTGFIDRRSEVLTARVEPGPRAVAAAAIALAESAAQEHAGFDGDPYSPWSPGPGPAQGFRLNAHPRASIRMELDGRSVDAAIAGAAGLEADAAWSVGAGDDALVGEPVEDQVWFWDGGAVTALPHPEGVVVFEGGDAFLFERPDYELHHEAEAGSGAVLAPMPGRIVAVHVAAGDAVEKGAKLVTLEAMKMEHGLTAPFAGKVAEVSAQAGGQVSEGTLLVRLEAPST